MTVTPYFQQDGVTLYHGDCREILAGLPDESVSAVVTDPPYGLAFMGKKWDYDVPAVEVWAECMRVLKPGGHLLAFAGTRTQHRMAVRIEDAGFEIRDMIAWVYGSGFSKGFNLRRAEICNCGGNPISCTQPTKEGNHGKSETEHDVRPLRESHLQASESAAEECQQSLLAHLQQQSAGLEPVAYAGGDSQTIREGGGQSESSVEGRAIYGTGQGVCFGPESQSSASEEKRVRSGAYFGCGGDAGATVGGRRGSAPHKSQQSGQQAGESAGVQQSRGTLDAGALRGRGACERCGKLKKEFEGFGTGLKPSHEPITVARKPLIGTVAENVLQHGTGALNVDGCRVGTNGGTAKGSKPQGNGKGIYGAGLHGACEITQLDAGRWPANLIHDGSEEVTGLFPADDDGEQSAARFFYTAKADKSDRGPGNNHPTVKPLDLMRYLVRLVCPIGGVVLDPFSGSGTTLAAAQAEGCLAIGVEREAAYCEIIKGRFHQRRLF